MKRPLAVLLTCLAATSAAAQHLDSLRARIVARIAQTPASAVGVYFHDLGSGDTLLIDANVRFHAASTMKVPVMIQLFRDRDAGKLTLDDSVPISNDFRSIVDGSPYQLDKADDSDSTLYDLVGQKRTIRQLVDLMETVSSNLATNLLIALVDAKRANATAHALGADSILVLRGVEDGKAYRAGMNNTTTARDLGVLFTALAQYRAASPAACREMLEVLGRQHFTEGIPAGLPAGTRVEHKTGWIGGVVYHDAGIVRPARGAPYVLVVLTGGVKEDSTAYRLAADVSQLVFNSQPDKRR
ncbi:MAG TPA: serine hydrolase [Gemmatimonadales bacterium]|nr:serine hydrolase [Gemmatimonadales bacterium]